LPRRSSLDIYRAKAGGWLLVLVDVIGE
jgi:hypothetical protein